MEKNKQTALYIIISAAILIIGHAFSNLALLHLVALVPIILLLKNNNEVIPVRNWLVPLALVLLFYQIFVQLQSAGAFNPIGLIYVVGITAATGLYGLIKANLNMRFGLFVVIILWLGFEYATLLILPELGHYFLFKTLSENNGAFLGHDSGFLAFSFWGLAANFIFAFVLFDAASPSLIKFRWLSLAYALIIVLAPYWVNQLFLSGVDINSWEMMMSKFGTNNLADTTYALRGEWLGKIALWLGVLITIYALVKKKVKR